MSERHRKAVAPGAGGRTAHEGRGRSVLALLADFAKKGGTERIRLGDLVRAFARRGHGLLLLLFALPSALPIYLPGIGAVFSVPLALISAQMLLGREHPWLPRRLLDRTIAREDYERLIGRAVPALARVERVLCPRLLGLTDSSGQRLIGLVCLALSLLLSLPVPFTKILLALPIALLGLALIAHDGLLMLGAIGVGIFAAGGTVLFGGKALAAAWSWAVG